MTNFKQMSETDNKFYVGRKIISNPHLDSYAMKCPQYTENIENNLNLNLPDIYVKQNTDSGMERVLNNSEAWRQAAKDGKFNYTACDACNLLGYTNKIISSKPDCNGNCFFIDSVEALGLKNDICHNTFDCGICNEYGFYQIGTEYGWYFNNFNCLHSIEIEPSCKMTELSCTFCDCKQNNIDIHYLADIVNLISKGIVVNNCYNFCRVINANFSKDNDVDILDIISIIKCIKDGNCINRNLCE